MTSVSVVIPTYDRPQFLPGAIETAVEQTCSLSEVIVVDDASPTDYAADIVADSPNIVRLLEQAETRGLSATRNTGIEASDAEYIAFLDDDDRWHRSKLERQLRRLEAKPEAGLVTCAAVRGPPGGPPRFCDPVQRPEGDLAADLPMGNPVGEPSRILVRRECFTDVGTFDESLETTEDWEFYLRLCQRWEVAAVEAHLVYLTRHSDNLSDDIEQRERDRMAIYRKHEPLVRSYHDWETLLESFHRTTGRQYLDVRDTVRAREHLRKALDYGYSTRTVGLYALSFLPPASVARIVAAKQAVDPRVGCGNLTIEVSGETFPGLRTCFE